MKYNVLWVEDDVKEYETYSKEMHLNPDLFAITWCKDVRTAMKELRNPQATWDLLVLDITIPIDASAPDQSGVGYRCSQNGQAVWRFAVRKGIAIFVLTTNPAEIEIYRSKRLGNGWRDSLNAKPKIPTTKVYAEALTLLDHEILAG